MKKFVVFLSLVFIIQSCSKDKKEKGSGSFTWNHRNVSHTATIADAYISQAGLGLGPNQIIANDGSTTFYRVSMRLSSLNPGSYAVSLTSNKFDYVDDLGFDLAGAQGTVTILSNSTNKLSGNFSVKLINASSDTTVITGAFSNILVHP